MSSSHSTRIRSFYRQLLRELPPRPASSRSGPSPLQSWARASLSYSPPSYSSSSTSPSFSSSLSSSHTAVSTSQAPQQRISPVVHAESLSVAEQALLYLRAQRTYVSLLERYNPAVAGDMAQDEQVRLTARRVGMEMPEELSGRMGKR